MTETIKEKIIRSLLASPKSTGDIAISLGYIDKAKHGKYNMVMSDLKTLRSGGFIDQHEDKKPGVPGPPPTVYDIVYNLSVIPEIVKKFPSLIMDLQKSEKIIMLLADNSQFNAQLFGDMLRLSPDFFENYLTQELFLAKFKKIWNELIKPRIKPLIEKEGLIFNDDDPNLNEIILFELFRHCVINDSLQDRINPGAINFIDKNEVTCDAIIAIINMMDRFAHIFETKPVNPSESDSKNKTCIP